MEPKEIDPAAEGQCRAVGCRIRVQRPRAFCERHWKFLDMPERRLLCDAFGTTRWARAFHLARQAIRIRDPEID